MCVANAQEKGGTSCISNGFPNKQVLFAVLTMITKRYRQRRI